MGKLDRQLRALTRMLQDVRSSLRGAQGSSSEAPSSRNRAPGKGMALGYALGAERCRLGTMLGRTEEGPQLVSKDVTWCARFLSQARSWHQVVLRSTFEPQTCLC